ncbi:MAG TPA: hypothetical protein VD969_04925 [Symbiobacteriaceae bacterium]|nr:hypothetical protein [Symbiobacteriaceae bacterium]
MDQNQVIAKLRNSGQSPEIRQNGAGRSDGVPRNLLYAQNMIDRQRQVSPGRARYQQLGRNAMSRGRQAEATSDIYYRDHVTVNTDNAKDDGGSIRYRHYLNHRQHPLYRSQFKGVQLISEGEDNDLVHLARSVMLLCASVIPLCLFVLHFVPLHRYQVEAVQTDEA